MEEFGKKALTTVRPPASNLPPPGRSPAPRAIAHSCPRGVPPAHVQLRTLASGDKYRLEKDVRRPTRVTRGTVTHHSSMHISVAT
jgi:hypothetical protein